MAKATMDVQFKNPFYHSKLGLLGGAGDEDTIYILNDNELLPRTAVVIEGVSQDRKKNEKQGKAAEQAAKEYAIAEELNDDGEEEEVDKPKPRRVRPKEGKAKGDNIPKKRKR